jgi:cellulose synthase/poly-beta-1,6-N-acetylglucosamine synthase-like glycosyltransferase
VERIAEHDSRLRLVNIGHLPEGWCGKNNAMQTAIGRTRGEWICMIDADCRQTSTATLRAAMQYALEHGADLLSVLPNLEMKGFWENVVQPVCGGILMIWFQPDKVNDPDRAHAYANGAFMLMKRSAYEAIGRHEAVKGQLNEDMHMAARVKGEGLRLRVARNEGLYLVRMYTSLGGIVRGWSRIFYGTFGTLRRLTISLAVLLFMGMLPYAAAALAWIAYAAGAEPRGMLLALGVAALVTAAMQISVIYSFRKLAGGRTDQAWTYPIGCAVAAAALVCAMGKLRKGARIDWRNTTYTRGEDGAR